MKSGGNVNTKCAKCNKELNIDCPLCYIAKIKGRFYCIECFYKEKAKQNGKKKQ